MNKPTPKIREIYNYSEMCEYIEHTYNCELRDYAAHKYGARSTYYLNKKHREKWEERHYPELTKYKTDPIPNMDLNHLGVEYYASDDGNTKSHKVSRHYRVAMDGAALEVPYLDFWHFLCDVFEMHNGKVTTINWEETKQYLEDISGENWKIEVCELFIKEFGSDDMEIEFSW